MHRFVITARPVPQLRQRQGSVNTGTGMDYHKSTGERRPQQPPSYSVRPRSACRPTRYQSVVIEIQRCRDSSQHARPGSPHHGLRQQAGRRHAGRRSNVFRRRTRRLYAKRCRNDQKRPTARTTNDRNADGGLLFVSGQHRRMTTRRTAAKIRYAYQNTSMAVFEKTIQSISGSLPARPQGNR